MDAYLALAIWQQLIELEIQWIKAALQIRRRFRFVIVLEAAIIAANGASVGLNLGLSLCYFIDALHLYPLNVPLHYVLYGALAAGATVTMRSQWIKHTRRIADWIVR